MQCCSVCGLVHKTSIPSSCYSKLLDKRRLDNAARRKKRRLAASFERWLSTKPIDKHLAKTLSPAEIQLLKDRTRI